jgi:hypothetical protein
MSGGAMMDLLLQCLVPGAHGLLPLHPIVVDA